METAILMVFSFVMGMFFAGGIMYARYRQADTSYKFWMKEYSILQKDYMAIIDKISTR